LSQDKEQNDDFYGFKKSNDQSANQSAHVDNSGSDSSFISHIFPLLFRSDEEGSSNKILVRIILKITRDYPVRAMMLPRV